MKQQYQPMMTVPELASYLRAHKSTVYRLLKQHVLPGFKVGSDWRFERKSVDQWMVEKGAWGPPLSDAMFITSPMPPPKQLREMLDQAKAKGRKS